MKHTRAEREGLNSGLAVDDDGDVLVRHQATVVGKRAEHVGAGLAERR